MIWLFLVLLWKIEVKIERIDGLDRTPAFCAGKESKHIIRSVLKPHVFGWLHLFLSIPLLWVAQLDFISWLNFGCKKFSTVNGFNVLWFPLFLFVCWVVWYDRNKDLQVYVTQVVYFDKRNPKSYKH